MMIFGTGTMIASKYMLSVCAADYDYNTTSDEGLKETFSKALYQSFIMFVAMAFCLPFNILVDLVYYAIFPDKKPAFVPASSVEEAKERRNTSIRVCLFSTFCFSARLESCTYLHPSFLRFDCYHINDHWSHFHSCLSHANASWVYGCFQRNFHRHFRQT